MLLKLTQKKLRGKPHSLYPSPRGNRANRQLPPPAWINPLWQHQKALLCWLIEQVKRHISLWVMPPGTGAAGVK